MENASMSWDRLSVSFYPGLANTHRDFVDRVDEIAQLWRLGAETAVLESRLRDLHGHAEQYFEETMACVGGLSDSVLLQFTREYETMVRKIDAVLADFAAGDGAVRWLEMMDAIELVRRHELREDSAVFGRPSESPTPACELLVQWTPELEFGIDWMDQHHRAMIDALNEIASLPVHCDMADVDASLERLRRIAWHHFHEEEARLPINAHEQVHRHVAQHRHLAAELDRIIFDVRSRRLNITQAVRDRLGQWLIDHIKTADREDFQGPLESP